MRTATLSLLLIWGAVPARLEASGPDPIPTDYETELRQTDAAISALQGGTEGMPADPGRAMRYIHLLYQRASLTGSLSELETAGARIDEAIQRLGPSEHLYLLRAQVQFKFHRLAAVKDDLARVVELAGSFGFQVLKADLDFQEGRYEEARSGYEDNARRHPTWDNLARLAYFRAKMGDIDDADRLYAQAGDEITAKEMRSFGWVELQRGLLALGAAGPLTPARPLRASRPGVFRLLAGGRVQRRVARRHRGDSTMRSRSTRRSSPGRPAGDPASPRRPLCLHGQARSPRTWHDKALTAYLESTRRGEVHYFHHLTAFYSDVREDGAEAENGRPRISTCGRTTRPGRPSPGLSSAAVESPKPSTK